MNGAIVRLEHSIQGDLGAWLFDGVIFCFTLQPDETDAGRFHLPAGDYICTKYNSPKHGMTFIIHRPETPVSVDGHDYLEVHAGNDIEDTLGCTVIGSSVGKLKGDRAVLNSGLTFQLFQEYTKDVDSFTLKIIDCYTA
jgi:hypothetical protein